MVQRKQFILNGEIFYTEQNINLINLLVYFNYDNDLFVLEHNKSICNKINWKSTFIQDQDQIEIVTIVGGG